MLNKCLCYATASGVTKLVMTIIVNLVTLFVPLKSDLDVQKQASEACLLNKCLRYASGVTKLLTTIIVNLVTLFVPLESDLDV